MKQKKSILVLAENVNYNRTSSGIRSFNMLNLLRKKYKVTCVCLESFDASAVLKLPDVDMVLLEEKATLNWILEGISKIPKVRGLSSYITGLTLYGYRLIKDWNRHAQAVLFEKDIALIFVLASGHDFHAHHAVARLKTKVPIVAHIHDPYPYNHYPEPYKQDKLKYRIQARQYKKVIRKVDYCSFPSLLLKELMTKYYPEIKNKSLLLPHPECIVPVSEFEQLNSDKLVPVNYFTLMHLGSLLGERDPACLFKAFKRFCESSVEKKQKARLLVIGRINNAHEELLEQEWDDFKNIRVINDRISYMLSKKIMSSASALIILEAVADFSPFMPGKLSDYIMAEKPIIALSPSKSEVSRLLGKNYPYISPVNDEDKIVQILNLLWEKWNVNKSLELQTPELKNYISIENTLSVFEKIVNC
jgi:glycosyltransferase involved in cell wall biosynthesis